MDQNFSHIMIQRTLRLINKKFLSEELCPIFPSITSAIASEILTLQLFSDMLRSLSSRNGEVQ
ncbi:MAG: hypothetical protein HWQ44_16350 [Nostoc sp. JL34]|nr:hypothetical protein [Nostoc sp. JL34]